MTKILIIDTNCSVNKGSAAQVISTVETLSRLTFDPDFVMWSHIPELDFRPCRKYGISVVGTRRKPFSRISHILMLFEQSGYLARCMLWAGLQKIGFAANKLLETEVLKEYSESALILDLSGDTLSDQNAYSIFPILGIIIGIVLKKKIAIFSQSIGHFRRVMVPLARFCLNRADLIVVRENETMDMLRTIGVDNPNTHVAAEIAFLLKPARAERVQEILHEEGMDFNESDRAPLIGIGTSSLIYNSFKSESESYVALMAKIADHLVEKMNAQIVLIPHVIIPQEYNFHDDRYVARRIFQTANNKSRIGLLEGDYSPDELKGVIGKCQLFIGARMHSNIAATSMHVPTIALAWSHKYYGIMKMLGQEKYVCDIRTTDSDKLVSKANDAWRHRDKIRKELASKAPELEKSALCGAKLVNGLLKPTVPRSRM